MKSNKYTSFKELYLTDFDLTDIYVMRQKWKKDVLFQMALPRKNTGIIFLNNCSGIYTDQKNSSFQAEKKSIVCLPQGSTYDVLNLDCGENFTDAILLEFNIVKNGEISTFSDSPFLLRDVNITLAKQKLEAILAAYEASAHSPLEVKTAVLEFLLLICKEKAEKDYQRFSVIRGGIEFIESNPLLDISIEEIAKSCNVSPCYFRRLFKEYASKTPNEYRLGLKLNMAKKMLEGNDCTTAFIAETLGFESASYFCRIFKKHFGITPGKYREEYQNAT